VDDSEGSQVEFRTRETDTHEWQIVGPIDVGRRIKPTIPERSCQDGTVRFTFALASTGFGAFQ